MRKHNNDLLSMKVVCWIICEFVIYSETTIRYTHNTQLQLRDFYKLNNWMFDIGTFANVLFPEDGF